MAEFKAKARGGWSSITIENNILKLKRFRQEENIALDTITNVSVSKSTYDLPLLEKTVTVWSQGKKTIIKRMNKQKAEQLRQIILDSQKIQKIAISEEKGGTDIATQLEKLAKLKDKGDLTEEEFNAQKQKLLNQ